MTNNADKKVYNTSVLIPTEENIKLCAKLINDGEVVGMPTETVYGLGANALNESAVKNIFIAKGRPQDNPLIVHIASIDDIKNLVTNIPDIAKKLTEKFWPGPLTIIFPKSDKVPLATSGGLDTVGIRMPSHKVARELIKLSGVPIAAPSANLSGSPSPTKAAHVLDDMNGRIPAILDGGSCDVGVESTVISIEDDIIRLLRPGKVSYEDLKTITDNVIIDKGVLNIISNDIKVRSPGMKYKHYAPKANVTLINSSISYFEDYVLNHNDDNTYAVVFDRDSISDNIKVIRYGNSSVEQAERVFDVLRNLDKIGAKTVYVRCPSKTGVGLAVYNRLIRAAAFKIIKEGE